MFRLVFLIMVMWSAGLWWFVNHPLDVQPPTKADAIIVLTGGSNRVQTAVTLWQQGMADRVFISGVADGVSTQDIYENTLLSASDIAAIKAKTQLGYVATDTNSNVKEVTNWCEQEQMHHIIVVTSNYHIRRVRLLFDAVSNITVKYVAVTPKSVRKKTIFTEYNKWLVTRIMSW